MNCKSGTLAFNMCIYDYMDVKGCGVSKLFEDEFLLEVVKSYCLQNVFMLMLLVSWLLS